MLSDHLDKPGTSALPSASASINKATPESSPGRISNSSSLKQIVNSIYHRFEFRGIA